MLYIKWLLVAEKFTRQYMDKHLSPLGLNSSNFIYVKKLCEEPGLNQKDFIDYFYINPSNITRAITYLIGQGYIVRIPSPEDKRAWTLYPTEKARAIYPTLAEMYDDWEETALKGYSQEEKEIFCRIVMNIGQKMLYETLEGASLEQ